ncbi:hypothetical protein ANO11243_031020 [Dothideomycetidae sp. 11243]|nr:hypothetical protein ANO11243_031020 [fungal sp. No.11243]
MRRRRKERRAEARSAKRRASVESGERVGRWLSRLRRYVQALREHGVESPHRESTSNITMSGQTDTNWMSRRSTRVSGVICAIAMTGSGGIASGAGARARSRGGERPSRSRSRGRAAAGTADEANQANQVNQAIESRFAGPE